MPYDPEHRARLYYDRSCGPCRFFASSVEGISRGHVSSIPLDAPSARSELGDLPEEVRYAAAHVVDRGGRSTGPDIVRSLVEGTFGPTAGRLIERHPTLDRPLRWLYLRFWSYRRDHGCAAGARA